MEEDLEAVNLDDNLDIDDEEDTLLTEESDIEDAPDVSDVIDNAKDDNAK